MIDRDRVATSNFHNVFGSTIRTYMRFNESTKWKYNREFDKANNPKTNSPTEREYENPFQLNETDGQDYWEPFDKLPF